MKTDTTGQEIRRLARERGLQVEVEQVNAMDGEALRFWFFLNSRGQQLIDGEGVGLQDEAALEFLNEYRAEQREGGN